MINQVALNKKFLKKVYIKILFSDLIYIGVVRK